MPACYAMEYLSCIPFSVTTIEGTLYVKTPNAKAQRPKKRPQSFK